MNSQEILTKYQKLHSDLGLQRNAVDKEKWAIDHAKCWTDCDEELKVRTAELLGKAKPTTNEQKERNELLTRFPLLNPVQPIPARNLVAEIDAIKADIDKLKSAK